MVTNNQSVTLAKLRAKHSNIPSSVLVLFCFVSVFFLSLQNLHLMAYRTFKLQIQSAQALRYTNYIRGMRTYAYVFICDRNDKCISHKAKTEKDGDGDANPKWNFDVMFSIDIPKAEQHSLTLVVKLMSHHSARPDTLIGEVRVPITELLEWFGDAAEDVHKVVNRYVVTAKGVEQGTLTFSYNFGKTLQHPPPDPTPVKGQPKVWKNLGRVTGPLIDAVFFLA